MNRHSTTIALMLATALGFCCSTDLNSADKSPPRAIPAVELPASDGTPRELHQLQGEKATVLVFLSVECPISNGYIPALNQLAKKYAAQGVRVIGLNANAGQTLKAIQTHVREYEVQFPVLKDAGAEVADVLGILVCPEVCLCDARGRVCYQGRIDDRYTRRGGAAREIQSRNLQDALELLLAGKTIATTRTEPLGCPLDRGTKKETSNPTENAVVFTRDIAPILQTRCQECHRPGGIGPFSLTTYDEARRWADDLVAFTASRAMPPWKAQPGHGEFANERRMPVAEIEQLSRWVAAGCPLGHERDMPSPQKFASEWRSGEPDLILEPAEVYVLGADGPDDYRCFVIPADGASDRYVKAFEILPGNAKIVHHVLLFIDDGNSAEQLDQQDPGPGYATTGGFPGFIPRGGLGGWAPGNNYVPLPAGMAKILPAKSKVVMQVHYHRSGKEEHDQTRVGLYFAKEPIVRAVFNFAMLPPNGPFGGLRIEPEDSNYQTGCSIVLPDELLLLGITPHMHLLGKEMRVKATLPDGTHRPLLWVNDWDFNWQESYRYREPLALPKGTRLTMSARFDNSTNNPHQPVRHPQLVRWGEQTTDEMCIAFLEVAPQTRSAVGELREPTTGERIRFLQEGRRLAGDNVDLAQLPWARQLRTVWDRMQSLGVPHTPYWQKDAPSPK